MHINLSLGILLVVLGGCMEGVYALPMKFTPKWKWEHVWGAGSLAALVLVPWPAALLTVPHLWNAFAQVGVKDVVWPTVFGLGWGAGSIFFGLGVDAVGIGVGISIILGLVAVVGSLAPLVLTHPEKLGESSGHVLMIALGVMIGGIILCGLAGSWREKGRKEHLTAATDPVTKVKRSFGLGLLFCILSGVLSPLNNFALIQGEHLRHAAIANGAAPGNGINAVWALVFTSCYGLNVAFCLLLMMRNGNLRIFVRAPAASYWLMAAMMGAFWAGGVIVYGAGVTYLGTFGPYAGFCLFLIGSITTGNVAGILSGEWRGSGGKAFATMMGGMAVLALAAILLGYANRLLAA